MKRVVTGINAEGKSYFVHDGPTPGRVDLGRALDQEIWVDDPERPDPTAATDPAEAASFDLEPPIGGSTLRIFTFRPAGHVPDQSPEDLARELARFDTGDAMEPENPGMHTTATIDYGIVLAGEIDLELDSGEVHLTAGDVVVQRATRHAWRNRGTEPCTMAFVVISSPNYR